MQKEKKSSPNVEASSDHVSPSKSSSEDSPLTRLDEEAQTLNPNQEKLTRLTLSFHNLLMDFKPQRAKFEVTAKRTLFDGGKVEYFVNWTHTTSLLQTNGWYTREKAEEIQKEIDSIEIRQILPFEKSYSKDKTGATNASTSKKNRRKRK